MAFFNSDHHQHHVLSRRLLLGPARTRFCTPFPAFFREAFLPFLLERMLELPFLRSSLRFRGTPFLKIACPLSAWWARPSVRPSVCSSVGRSVDRRLWWWWRRQQCVVMVVMIFGSQNSSNFAEFPPVARPLTVPQRGCPEQKQSYLSLAAEMPSRAGV